MQFPRPILAAFGVAAAAVALAGPPAPQPAADCCAIATPLLEPATQPVKDARQAVGADALFEKLKTLVGTWNAEVQGDPTTPTCKFEYTMTGGGSTLVENQTMHGGMMTMYALDPSADGGRVIATHYCGAGNQPRMTSAGLAHTHASFAFLDATGMKSENDPHMHGLTLTFNDDGTVTQDWILYMEGKPAGVVTIKLTREK